ncbi:hypothetical protein YC2023_102071 [Brassica napus]|uniref:(rape) hypothetical protein n=1 Tax=Brassica napus TaxID=3708 RepID=A0A816UAL3_BRANA|nr:unnamed protein product [Brassica napus]
MSSSATNFAQSAILRGSLTWSDFSASRICVMVNLWLGSVLTCKLNMYPLPPAMLCSKFETVWRRWRYCQWEGDCLRGIKDASKPSQYLTKAAFV